MRNERLLRELRRDGLSVVQQFCGWAGLSACSGLFSAKPGMGVSEMRGGDESIHDGVY